MGKNLTTKEFIKKSKKIHGNKYGYNETNYINAETKVKIYCNTCQDFFYQVSHNHLRGYGCKICGIKSKRLTKKEFTKRAKKVHNNKYDYSKSVYINNYTKIKIYCKSCQKFFYQRPRDHLKYGCRDCVNKCQRSTIEEFIKKAKKVHRNLYDYSESIYINNYTKIKIYCKSCQKFFYQRPYDHSKYGCLYCTGSSISKISQEWLDSFKNPNIIREKTIKIGKRNYVVDGYDPKTNTIYEFYGDFWHGNPDVFNPSDINPKNKTVYGELYDKTMKRHDKLIKYGYNIISVWENDWKNKIGGIK